MKSVPVLPAALVALLITAAGIIVFWNRSENKAPVWLTPTLQAIGMSIPVLMALWPLKVAKIAEEKKRLLDILLSQTALYIRDFSAARNAIVSHQSAIPINLNLSRREIKSMMDAADLSLKILCTLISSKTTEEIETSQRSWYRLAQGDAGLITSKAKALPENAPLFAELRKLSEEHCLSVHNLTVETISGRIDLAANIRKKLKDIDVSPWWKFWRKRS